MHVLVCRLRKNCPKAIHVFFQSHNLDGHPLVVNPPFLRVAASFGGRQFSVESEPGWSRIRREIENACLKKIIVRFRIWVFRKRQSELRLLLRS